VHGWTDETERLAQDVLRYARERLQGYPPPLGGTSTASRLAEQAGSTITPDGIGADAAFRIFREVLSPADIAVDHPRFLAFIPAAPSEHAVLFDLVVSASSIFGGTWLERRLRRERGAAVDLRAGRLPGDGRRVLRLRRDGREPLGARRRAPRRARAPR
jgi:hypothetical protein